MNFRELYQDDILEICLELKPIKAQTDLIFLLVKLRQKIYEKIGKQLAIRASSQYSSKNIQDLFLETTLLEEIVQLVDANKAEPFDACRIIRQELFEPDPY